MNAMLSKRIQRENGKRLKRERERGVGGLLSSGRWLELGGRERGEGTLMKLTSTSFILPC